MVLRTVTGAELVEDFRNALSDVLYGFCVRYAEASKAALIATLNLPKFFARPGLLTESEKNLFVAAAVRQPVHPRQRFQGKYVDSSFVSSLGSTAQCFDHNFCFSLLFVLGLNRPTGGEKEQD